MNRKIAKKLHLSVQSFRGKSPSEKIRLLAVGAAFCVHILLISITPQFRAIFSQFKLSDFETGKPAPHDLYVDKDITYIDEEATALRMKAVASLVSPVFVVNEELSGRSLQRFADFSVLIAEARTKSSSSSKIFLEVQASLPGFLTQEQVTRLLETGNVLPNLNESRATLDLLLNRGIVSSLDSTVLTETDTFEIVRNIEGEQSRMIVPASSIVEIAGIEDTVIDVLKAKAVEEKNHGVIVDIVAAFAEENAFYDQRLTEERRIEALDEVSPVVSKLIKGERIAQAGVITAEEDMEKISALAEYSTTVHVNRIFGAAFLVVFLCILAVILFNQSIIGKRLTDSEVLLLIGLSLFYTGLAVVLTRFAGDITHVPLTVLMPTALMSMIVAILIGNRASVVFGLLVSFSLLPLMNMDPYPVLFAFFTGVSGTIVVSGAQKRLDLMRATIFLATSSALVVVALSILKNLGISKVLIASGWGFLNGFACGILNLGLLPFLEHLLNASTPFRLIELSDLNSPIMKRMLTLAPGTYGHSVAVANLAESACREIGANPLLARVGAYYHDIGKIDQAEYFAENQTDENKLNELKPSLSVAVIKSHVKIGVEKGKELGLPQEVLKIISQHHGSGLISYFYAQAIKDKGKKDISPGDYSYSGTPPVSKEAAVVMLADGVEAASRTLKKPNVSKLEKFVWQTIQDKFASQQMSNCELTFRDLEIIKRSFVHILAGHYHSRIEYPDIKGNAQPSGEVTDA